ncbi:tyrosine-type recombinase/integrase [Pararhizobium sp.]|uniref:tyrosine-type recombinase/integrase n=1 Tax=Pararhizobium sp. TaxID=1977563 RepID=UPI003D124D46
MSVYRRPGSETFSYDFRRHGHRFSGSTRCTSRRKAEQFEKALKEQVTADSIDPSKPMSFGAASTLYWVESGQFHANPGDTEDQLAWLQSQIGKQTALFAINDAFVARLVAKRRGDGVSNATVNRTVIDPLRAILNRARDIWDQKIAKIRWRQHKLKVAQERIREASIAEEREAREAIREDYLPALLFAFLNGCRRAEIVGLTWQNVDFFNREFTVTGKGDRSRTIPMTDETYALLWSQRQNHPTAVFTYVCRRPMRKGQVKGRRYPITIAGFKTEWRRARARTNLVDFRFHDTRHTAATRLLRATGNLRLAQELLGHTDIATTSRYSHVTKEDLRAGLQQAAGSATETPTKNTTQGVAVTTKSLRKNG